MSNRKFLLVCLFQSALSWVEDMFYTISLHKYFNVQPFPDQMLSTVFILRLSEARLVYGALIEQLYLLLLW